MSARRKILLSAATLAVFAAAWFTGRQVGVSTSFTTRLYDVRDLLSEPANFDNGPTLGISPSPAPASPLSRQNPGPGRSIAPPKANSVVDSRLGELAQRIRGTIDPESWNAPGCAITPMAGHLAITHTRAGHEKIATFLSELRASATITIMVEATSFTIDPDNIPRLPERLRSALSATPGSTLLSEGDVSRLFGGDFVTSVLSKPRITVFSGQRAYVLVGNQRAFVAGIRQTQDADGKVTNDPAIETASAGWLLDLHAAVSADRKDVKMTLRPQYAELLRIENAEHKTPDGKTHMIQRPVVSLRNLQTTLSVPDRQYALLNAFDQKVSPTNQPTTQSVRQIFLLVKPTIIRPPPGDNAKVLPGGK